MNNDLAYIAGFFDGEGYVGIYNYKAEGTHKNDRKRLQLGITNTNRDVLDWIKKRFNFGHIKEKSRSSPNWKICYEWTVRDRNAMKFLKMIYPYLRVKKKIVKSLIMGIASP